MSKKLSSTLLLFMIGLGFGAFSLYSITHAHNADDTITGWLYMIPAVAAFGALVMLPFKEQR